MAKPSHIETGGQVVALPASVDELLKRVHARRKLPPADERHGIRVAAGLSLREVGEALGVSHTAVSDWERGATPRERQRVVYGRLLDELRRLA
jgi:DNA-binding transcriptional regulator YiaG